MRPIISANIPIQIEHSKYTNIPIHIEHSKYTNIPIHIKHSPHQTKLAPIYDNYHSTYISEQVPDNTLMQNNIGIIANPITQDKSSTISSKKLTKQHKKKVVDYFDKMLSKLDPINEKLVNKVEKLFAASDAHNKRLENKLINLDNLLFAGKIQCLFNSFEKYIEKLYPSSKINNASHYNQTDHIPDTHNITADDHLTVHGAIHDDI